MKFTPMHILLNEAEDKGIALGAFEFWSLETARAAINAGNKLGLPVILQAGQTEIDMLGGFEETVAIVEIAAKNSKEKVALHLDHATSYEACEKAINAGFSSVMIDMSAHPFEENIRVTKQVVDLAHSKGVSVEAELGRLVGEEGEISVSGPEGTQTDPLEAEMFVKETNVDCLAAVIGTQHGIYKFEPNLNIERLKEIRSRTNIPLVLHGGSGTPMDQVQESIRQGIRKVNICTDIVVGMGQAYIDTQSDPNFSYSTINLFGPANEKAEEVIIEKMKAFALGSL